MIDFKRSAASLRRLPTIAHPATVSLAVVLTHAYRETGSGAQIGPSLKIRVYGDSVLSHYRPQNLWLVMDRTVRSMLHMSGSMSGCSPTTCCSPPDDHMAHLQQSAGWPTKADQIRWLTWSVRCSLRRLRLSTWSGRAAHRRRRATATSWRSLYAALYKKVHAFAV